jgi:hypothetical protein
MTRLLRRFIIGRLAGSPHRRSVSTRPAFAALLFELFFGAAVLGAGCGGASTAQLTADELRDPETCRTCHPTQYDEWSGSMHAYAADDPIFLAMNARAQRETNGGTGKFCVNCHAPLAVRDGLTKDGLDLASVPQAKKGVTCYFCHAAESVFGTHDNPIDLASDDSLFGPFADPVAATPHAAKTSPLFDDSSPQSARFCGSCHDIVNMQNAHVERTYQEWQASLFSQPGKGLSCQACHMDGSDGPASNVSTRIRRVHKHDFPAVDLALTSFPNTDAQRARAQTMLDTTVQSTVCWNPRTSQIEVTLDNVGAGHGFPSGATPDRRAWVEVTASLAGQTTYSSGGPASLPLEGSTDPDLWLVRDCLLDAGGAETRMFWQAASVSDDQLPAAATANVNDPASFMSHRQRTFPSGVGKGLPAMPDHITVALHLQAVGDDVLADLVATKDLDAAVPPLFAKYTLASAALDWTPATAKTKVDPSTNLPRLCVTSGTYNANVTPADSHARCGN